MFVGFIMCVYVCEWDLQCVCVCGFYNVCVYVDFIMCVCGFYNVCVCLRFIMRVCVWFL